MSTPQKISRIEALNGKKIAVVGFGARTGVSLAAFLMQHGCTVALYDRLPSEANSIRENLLILESQLKKVDQKKLRHDFFACSDFSWLQECDLVVTSPGVALDQPIFKSAKQFNKSIVGELEFSSWFLSAPIIAVTGTNGKTTTCALLQQIFDHHGDRVFVGGNYGNPLVNAIGEKWDLIIAEVSSFQLETTYFFHPHLTIILNISEDHLDRHASLAEYAEIKARLLMNQQQPTDWAIVNLDDPLVMKVTESYAVRKLGFSMKNHPQAAIYNQGHEIIMDLKTIGGQRLNFSLANYPLPGAHNIQNLLAALAAAALMGVDERCMQETIDLASAPRHRLEPAAHRNGVRFINDSKSTTVDSTLMALKAFSEPIILILGGKDKGTDFKLLKPEHQTKLKAIVAYGEVAPRMKDEIAFSGPFVVEQFFDDAVKAAMQLADKGEVVLLSPATSSLDQFKNYEERGNRFCELTQGLAQ